jgi:hypothetical protein
LTARSTLAELADFLGDPLDLDAATFARSRGDAPPEPRALSLAGDAEGFFRDVIATRVGDLLSPLAWALKRLDPLYKPDDDEVEWQRLDALDPVAYAIGKLANTSATLPFDGGDEAYKQRLIYWAVTLTHTDGRQAQFFRSFTASAELKRKRGAAFVSRNGTFTVVEDAIFLFDDQIDCFAFGDYVYILRKRDFRRIFDQLQAVLRRAKKAAQDLHRQVPIANVLAVRRRDYFGRLSYAMLAPVIAEFSLNIPTAEVDGVTQLVFASEPDQRFRILKLVDDDYLNSSMTDHRYEVNSKTDPPA